MIARALSDFVVRFRSELPPRLPLKRRLTLGPLLLDVRSYLRVAAPAFGYDTTLGCYLVTRGEGGLERAHVSVTIQAGDTTRIVAENVARALREFHGKEG